MISLEPQIGIALLTIVVTALSAFWAVKSAGRETRIELGETQRLVKALHGRFDRVEARVARGEIGEARLDERVKAIERERALRTTARFTAGRPQDVFAPEDTEG